LSCSGESNVLAAQGAEELTLDNLRRYFVGKYYVIVDSTETALGAAKFIEAKLNNGEN
jgi:hypothetical protein